MKSAAVLMIFSIVSGCAGTLVDPPSLNKRPFEITLEEMRAQAKSENITKNPFQVAQALSDDALMSRLDADIVALWKRHKQADAVFSKDKDNIRDKVNNARGAAFGSENWAAAQVVLSRLDRLRAPSVQILGQIDTRLIDMLDNRSAIEESNRASYDEGLANLAQLQERIASDVTKQSRFIERLDQNLAQK